MQFHGKASRIRLWDFRSPPMRAFHMSWIAFFLCFFAWFGIAPLMKVVREELHLTHSQVGWTIIASVAATVVARLLIGWLCDQIGPRKTYTWLLVLGSLPVMAIGLSHSFITFLIFRLLIGAIGASFIITQYHTSIMFEPNCIGTANATTAGWGNMGGGVTQLVMPLLFALLIGFFGLSDAISWRLCMVIVGVLCMFTGVTYYKLTQDTPQGNFQDLRARGLMPSKEQNKGMFWQACRDRRVWVLFVIYAACFGMELTANNVMALYFLDTFDFFKNIPAGKAMAYAGGFAAAYGITNLFARSLGGAIGDQLGMKFGLKGRVRWLFVVLLGEGLALMLFSQISVLTLAIPALMLFSLFTQMSNGATFSIVPFINKKAIGSVAGIVGAGGNAGAVVAGFLFKGNLPWNSAFFILGLAVCCCSTLVLTIRFSPEAQQESEQEMIQALAQRNGMALELIRV